MNLLCSNPCTIPIRGYRSARSRAALAAPSQSGDEGADALAVTSDASGNPDQAVRFIHLRDNRCKADRPCGMRGVAFSAVPWVQSTAMAESVISWIEAAIATPSFANFPRIRTGSLDSM